jgi:hypothetical protein
MVIQRRQGDTSSSLTLSALWLILDTSRYLPKAVLKLPFVPLRRMISNEFKERINHRHLCHTILISSWFSHFHFNARLGELYLVAVRRRYIHMTSHVSNARQADIERGKGVCPNCLFH